MSVSRHRARRRSGLIASAAAAAADKSHKAWPLAFDSTNSQDSMKWH